MGTASRRLPHLVAFVVIVGGGATVASAQPTNAAPLTLAAVEELALRNNPTVTAARATVDAMRARAVQAGALNNSVIGYTGSEISSSRGAHGVFVERSRIALFAQSVPQMVEGHGACFEAVAPEGMHERVAFVAPAVELDGELDRAIRGFHDFEGIESERLKVAPYCRHCRLADTDGADIG